MNRQELEEQVRWRVWDRVRVRVGEQAWDRAQGQAALGQTEGLVCDQVWEAVWLQCQQQVLEKLEDSI